ncbi:MAG: arsenic efflux protein [Bacilli bacterium]|nr:arsenic efflux protein [Bacilli bacterium]
MLDIILDTLIDIIKIIPFILLAFVLIEIFEHRFNKKSKKIMEKTKRLGPLFGSVLGLIPQCGFSVFATDLYITRIISLGTLISIYLATSDEMLIVMISEKVDLDLILKVLLIKFVIGIICGFIIDLLIRKRKKKEENINYSICNDEHCHCDEDGIVLASIKHTLKIVGFIFIITFVINILMEYKGNDFISKLFLKDNPLSPFISSLVGLIPSCGSSVILTELYIENAISFSSMMAGLLTNSGVALIVLFRSNKEIKENLIVLGLLYLIGVISGIILHIIGI